MQVLNYTDFRKNLKAVLDKTAENDDVVIVSRSHDKDVVLLSLHEYNSWMETMHLLRTDANRKRLADSISRVEKGNYESHDLMED